jgi:hypothetical protein
MALTKIIHFIETLIEEKLAAKKSSDISFIKVLETTRQLLEECQDGKDIDTLESAIRYLERVPISVFLSTIPLGVLLENDNYPVLITETELRYLPSAAQVDGNHHHTLGSIQIRLLEYMKFLLKSNRNVAWNISYPLENREDEGNSSKENGKDPIGDWQSLQMIMQGSPTKAMKDFVRDIYIQGRMDNKKKSETEIHTLIDKLMGKLTGYDQHDQTLFAKWLKCNGGQDNNRFIDYLLMYEHFTEEPFTSGKSKALDQIWYIANNTLCFSCDTLLYSIVQGTEKTIMIDPTSDRESATCRPQVKVSPHPEELAKYKLEDLHPLMRIKARIELTIMAGTGNKYVMPSIKELNVTSYTDFLKTPKGLISSEQTHANTTIKLGHFSL